MKFSEFRAEHGGQDRGMHRAAGKTLRDYYNDCEEQGRFPKTIGNDENSRYQWIFEKVDKAASSLGQFRKKIVKPERLGPNKCFNLVSDWIEKNPETRTVKKPSAMAETEPLMVYFYFSYGHKDIYGEQDRSFAAILESYLEPKGAISARRTKRKKGKTKPHIVDSGADVKLHVPKEIKDENAWLSANNFSAIPLFGREREWQILDGFLEDESNFSILPVIAPSGAGKTRLVTEWLLKGVDPSIWNAGFLKDVDPDIWRNWHPNTDTLIIVDYVFQYKDSIRILVDRAVNLKANKVRLILIDHLLPEQFESLPRNATLRALAADASEFDERKEHFYKEGPLWLSKNENRVSIVRSIISHVSGNHAFHRKVRVAIADLLDMGDAAIHPLFAALIGFAIKQSDYVSRDKPSRRELIKYYFDKKQRLPWLNENLPLGKWIGMFVSVATARRIVGFDTLIEHLPQDIDKSRSALQPVFEHCERIIGARHELGLRAFEPDIMGETFLLMFLSEYSTDTKSEFWKSFCSLMENSDIDDRSYVTMFVGFMVNLLRNLNNDLQEDEYVRNFWQALLVFLNSNNFSENSEFRIGIAEVTIAVAQHENAPPIFKELLLEEVHFSNLIELCENHPTDAFYAIGSMLNILKDDIYTDHWLIDLFDRLLIVLEELGISKGDSFVKAAGAGWPIVVAYMAQQGDIDPNHLNGKRISATMTAIFHDDVDTLAELLALKHLDPNLCCKNSVSPLIACVILNCIEGAKLLINGREDIDLNYANEDGETALLLACEFKREEIALDLALSPSIAPNLADDIYGRRPLSIASQHGLQSVVTALLSTGKVDINEQSKKGMTPLLSACTLCRTAVVEILILFDELDLNLPTFSGVTALQMACYSGCLEVVKLLLTRKDLDVQTLNSRGKTAIEVAREEGHEAIAKLIEQHLEDSS